MPGDGSLPTTAIAASSLLLTLSAHADQGGPARSGQQSGVAEWTAVKIRWRLTVNTAEKNTLTSVAAGCSNVTLTVVRAF